MSTISKLNVDAIIDKSITSDKLADEFMLLSDALENEEVIAAALTELNNTKADKTAINEITQALASKADAEAVSALQQDLDSKAGASELNNYLPLSGGTLTGNLITPQITNNGAFYQNGPGLYFGRTDGVSYIWNTASKAIVMGTSSIGGASESNASLIINGTDIYPGIANTINLGTSSKVWNNIYGTYITAKKFRSGAYSKSSFDSDYSAGLQIAYQIAKNGDVAGDYGFPASNNANGVISFRTYTGSETNNYYKNYLGFSAKGLFYLMQDSGNKWVKLNNPSIFQASVPELYEYSSASLIIPEMINENVINVFHKISQSNITIERSQDGSTWIDTTETDYTNFYNAMTMGKGGTRPVVAYDGSNGQVGDRVRITINGAQAYSVLSHLYVYYTTYGNKTTLTVERNTYSDQDTWTTIIDKETVTGWSGPNYYGLNKSVIGGKQSGQYYSYRLTFEITAISEGYSNNGTLTSILCFSSQKPYSIANDPTLMWYFDLSNNHWVSNHTIRPRYDVIGALGTSSTRWSAVYAKAFYGDNFYGTATKATYDADGNKFSDTYALASICYGGPEGKFAIGNQDNLIGKALTNTWGIYNKNHTIIISEYDSSTETWVQKFNSATLSGSSYDNFTKGLKSSFYTSTRGSKVKMTVINNNGAAYYIQAISLYLVSKDATYSDNIDYTYSTNSGYFKYSGELGTWGSWCPITMSSMYRTSFEIIFNENEANTQLKINGFRIVTNISNDSSQIFVGKSHQSYTADKAAKVGDDTIQLYAQSGNEINFGGTNTTTPSIVFGYKSADGNQIVPTEYVFGKNATASVSAAKFITTDGTSSQVVLGDGTLKNMSDILSNVDLSDYYTKEEIGIRVRKVTQDEYDALETKDENILYIITDIAADNTLILDSITVDSITTNNIVLNGISHTKLLSGLIYSELPLDGTSIPAGYNFSSHVTGKTIDTYTGFTMDTPDTVIVSTYPITFSGSIMKMEGIENLSGNFYIYCLSFMANQMVAVNGAAYN